MTDIIETVDYNDIERRLQMAQREIGEALSSLSTVDNNDQSSQPVDFFSIFSDADLQLETSSSSIPADVERTFRLQRQTSAPNPSCSDLIPNSAAGSLPWRRPDRPTTLSRPVQLPSCCNFRRQPWRLYVHGEFSYSSNPRFYNGLDEQMITAEQNEDIVRIIDGLQPNSRLQTEAMDSIDGTRTENRTLPNDTRSTNGTDNSSATDSSRNCAKISSINYDSVQSDGHVTEGSDFDSLKTVDKNCPPQCDCEQRHQVSDNEKRHCQLTDSDCQGQGQLGTCERHARSRHGRNRSLQRNETAASQQSASIIRRSRTLSPTLTDDRISSHVTSSTAQQRRLATGQNDIRQTGNRNMTSSVTTDHLQTSTANTTTTTRRSVSNSPRLGRLGLTSLRCFRRKALPADVSSTSSQNGHVTSLPAIDENEAQRRQQAGAKHEDVSRRLSASASVAADADNDDTSRRHVTLLDAMHKKYYPGQYAGDRTRLTEQLDDNVTTAQTSSTVPHFVTSRSTTDDVIKTAGVMPSGADVPEVALLQVCRWLVSAGFQQYVQLFADDQLTSRDVEELADDHRFLNDNWRQTVEIRLSSLLECVPGTLSISKEFLTGSDLITCRVLSRKWYYDRLGCRWMRCNLPSVHLSSRPLTLHRSCSSPTGSRLLLIQSTAEAGSPSLADTDAGNHVTSGYESETSPTNTRTDDGRSTSTDGSPSGVSTCSSSNSSFTPPIGSRLQPGPLADSVELSLNWPPSSAVLCRDDGQQRLPRSASFYDNLSISDPQAELEMILDDLRRNITALDAALATPDAISPSAVAVQLETETETSLSFDHTQSPTSLDSGCVDHVTSRCNQLSAGQVCHCPSPVPSSTPFTCHRTYEPTGRDGWSLQHATSRHDDVESDVMLMCATDLALVRELCLIELTGLFEKHCETQQALSIINSLTSIVSSKFKENRRNDGVTSKTGVFGVSLQVHLGQTGSPIPQCIAESMDYVRQQAADADGVFRRPGVLSRVQNLQDSMNAQPDASHIDDDSDVYSVADVVKRYFRDLPQSLFTDQMAAILISIFAHLPEKVRLKAVCSALFLLPDANRLAVYQLMMFLHGVAEQSSYNQMNASNLAVCFLPSLFRITDYSQKTSTLTGHRDDYQLRYKAALACLRLAIENAPSLLQVPDGLCRAMKELRDGNAPTVAAADYIQRLFDDLRIYASTDKNNHGVMVLDSVGNTDIRVSRQNVIDEECGLFIWHVSVSIEASPVEVLKRLVGPPCDATIHNWNKLSELDANTDLVEYTLVIPQLRQPRHFTLLRCWRQEECGRCVLVSKSVVDVSQSTDDEQLDGFVVAGHYLIEPSGTGMSQLTYVTCVDFRGHSCDWYQAVYPRICSSHVTVIRNSFRHDVKVTWSRGPETKL